MSASSTTLSAPSSPSTVSRPLISAISTHAAVSPITVNRPPPRQVSAIGTHSAVSPPSSQVSANSSHSTTQNQTQMEEEWTEEEMKSRIQPLLELIEMGDFSTIKTELDNIPNASLGRKINSSGETFLHVVIETGNVKLVKYLVGRMGTEHLGRKDMHGDHPLIFAARVGMVNIAEAILVRNVELPEVPNDENLLPVTVAVHNGNRYMADYLFKKTPANCYSASLAVAAISSDMHHIALHVLKSSGGLAFPADGQQRNVLSVLAEKPSAFRSGCHFGVLDAIVYEVLGAPSKAQSLAGCCTFFDNICENMKEYAVVRFFVKLAQEINVVRAFWRFIKFCLNLVTDYKNLRAQKLMHLRVLDILQILKDELSSLDATKMTEFGGYKSILKASENGIIELVSELVKCCPAWKSIRGDDGATIFDNALLQRRELVFNLLYEYKYRKMINVPFCSTGNFLHIAGSVPSPSQRNRISGAALLLQRELQWFKAVEELVPPHFKEERNLRNQTPRELFTENHKDILKQGEKWMKETSRACMVVATLIATVVFTAAFTLPGGNIERSGIPVFLEKWLFKLFIMSDALSLFSSLTSMLMFLAILTSRFAEDDFLIALPRKMIFGLLSLFLSIVFMIAAFCLTVFMIFHYTTRWLPWLSVAVACFPILLYVSLQFRLLVDMIWATYGPSIFGQKVSFLAGVKDFALMALWRFIALVVIVVVGVFVQKLLPKNESPKN